MVSLSNAPVSRVPPAAPPRDAASVFISGHSLTDRPMPDHWAAIAHSLGTPLQWNRQYIEGSSIAARTRGSDPAATDWPGYRSGRNREGEGLDVIAELRNPTTITGRYDALVVTEQHALLGSLHRHDTLRCLRHLHDRLIEGNPMGTTYFYEPWLGLDDKTDPRRWVAYERAASPIWQGIVTRINTSLAAEGRADRIQSLPMGLAFAELIDLATRPAGLPDVSQFSVQATVNSLIADRVHPTDLGSYYAALVTHAMVYARSPIGAWHPKHIGADTARTLQRVAWEFVSHYRGTHYSASNVALTLDEVQARLRESFIGLYFGYVRDTYWREELGTARAWARWARHRREWLRRMANQDADNPFHFDAATDRAHWLPAP